MVILNDNQWEPDEDFSLTISNPQFVSATKEGLAIKVRDNYQTIVCTIIDDDEPGVLGFFDTREYRCSEACKMVEITVIRKDGADGGTSGQAPRRRDWPETTGPAPAGRSTREGLDNEIDDWVGGRAEEAQRSVQTHPRSRGRDTGDEDRDERDDQDEAGQGEPRQPKPALPGRPQHPAGSGS